MKIDNQPLFEHHLKSGINLFLGAGFSVEASSKSGKLPVGDNLKDELLEAIINKKGGETLGTIRLEILVTNRIKPIAELLEKFVEKNEHVTLVVDEYGSVSGLVTMEDVIETILGMQIVDESDSTDDMRSLARKKWEARAKATGLFSQEKEK